MKIMLKNKNIFTYLNLFYKQKIYSLEIKKSNIKNKKNLDLKVSKNGTSKKI